MPSPRSPHLGMTLALALAALLASPARAEAPRFGLQIHANGALGDLKDAAGTTPGAGAGVHLTFDLGGGHLLRPCLDAVFYAEHTYKNVAYKARDLSLYLDYQYFPGGRTTGFYLTAGLGLHHWSVDSTFPTIPPYPGGTGTRTSTDPGYAAGLGFNGNRTLGAELRFVGTVANHIGLSSASGANALQAGVTIRF